MKIVFICGSLQNGKDGVGDYCFTMAERLSREGVPTCLLSLHDKFITAPCEEIYKGEISILRLPASLPANVRAEKAGQWIEKEKPDVISLQYVPYSFHKKGIPASLPGMLKKISGGRPVHIMFHELWQGEGKQSSLKEKMIGALQRMISRRLSAQSCVKAFTNCAFYSRCLSREKIDNLLVPIFSNLPVAAGGTVLYDALPVHVKENRNGYVIAVFFSAVHFDNRLGEKISQLYALVSSLSKKLLVVHTGKTHFGPDFTAVFSSRHIEFVALGEQPAQLIADFFSVADIGLSTHPAVMYQKSGSMAAMLNNGLPVIILRDYFLEDINLADEVQKVENISSLARFMHQPKTFMHRYSAGDTLTQYLFMLTEIQQNSLS